MGRRNAASSDPHGGGQSGSAAELQIQPLEGLFPIKGIIVPPLSPPQHRNRFAPCGRASHGLGAEGGPGSVPPPKAPQDAVVFGGGLSFQPA